MAAYKLATVSHTQLYLCTLFIVYTSRVQWYSSRQLIAPPFDWEFSQQRAVNDGACWQGHWWHHPSFLSVEIALLRWKLGRCGRGQMLWSNPWGANLGCGLCSCKSLGCDLWATLHPKIPWCKVKKNPSSIPSCAPKIPLHFAQIPSKNGVFEMWQ